MFRLGHNYSLDFSRVPVFDEREQVCTFKEIYYQNYLSKMQRYYKACLHGQGASRVYFKLLRSEGVEHPNR